MLVFYALLFGIMMLSGDETVETIATFVLYIPLLWVSLAVQVKRWHDRGKPGTMALIGLIPCIGGIWVFIECGCLPGDPRPNVYGYPTP